MCIQIGPSADSGTVEAPLWSYKLGLDNGWMPKDPREAFGICESLGVDPNTWNETYPSYATGGAGADEIAASSVASYGAWPPTSINDVPTQSMAYLPQYTATASVVSLPPPTTFAAATVSTPGGWFDTSDVRSAPTAIAGCEYPDAWSAVNAAVPTSGCGAGGDADVVVGVRRAVPAPVITGV